MLAWGKDSCHKLRPGRDPHSIGKCLRAQCWDRAGSGTIDKLQLSGLQFLHKKVRDGTQRSLKSYQVPYPYCLLPTCTWTSVLACCQLSFPCLYVLIPPLLPLSPIFYISLFWYHLLFSYILIAQEWVFTWEVSPRWD